MLHCVNYNGNYYYVKVIENEKYIHIYKTNMPNQHLLKINYTLRYYQLWQIKSLKAILILKKLVNLFSLLIIEHIIIRLPLHEIVMIGTGKIFNSLFDFVFQR